MDPIETVDLFDETPITVESTVHPKEMGEGTSGNLTAQISPNFRFGPERIDIERVTECMRRTPTRPVADPESHRTPPTSGNKGRNLFAISPVKSTSRKRTNTEAVKTLAFCDFETSGLFTGENEPKKNYNLRKSRCPSEFASELEKFCMDTQKDNYPRILELSFVAVARDTFEKSVKQLDLKNQPGASSLRVRVPCNIHTRQINPKMTDSEWEQYDRVRSVNPVALVHDKNDLHLKNSFDVEWKQVREFLDSCPKPVCLVAHNGLYFDFRLLFGELSRYGLLQSQALPDGILFVDSLLALQNIEDSLKLRLEQTLNGIDWNLISRLTMTEEVVTIEASEQPNDHPFNFLDKNEWPTAFFRRFSAKDFKKASSGKWQFAPSGKKYNMKNLYETIIGGGFDFHYAQDDSQGLLQICLAYGKEFLTYLDSSAAESVKLGPGKTPPLKFVVAGPIGNVLSGVLKSDFVVFCFVACHQAATKPQLLSILKDFYDSKGGKEKLRAYRVDKLAKEYGVEVLRLPPYHCMLNPIEKFWAYLKGQLRSTTSGEERLVELEEEAIGNIKRMPEEQQRNIFQNAKSVEDEFIAKEGLSFKPVLQDDEEEPPFSQFDEEYDSEDEYY